MTTKAFAAGAYAAIQNIGRTPAAGVAGAGEGGFTQLLSSALDGVAEAGKRADGQALAAAAGKANVVDVVTAVAESETALQTLVAVRDRVISAYEDILRMQI
ncbi:flagellar hook-basal body protein FliE [Methylobacterium tarhaniae]|uniref:Flagellar hook-basal body complex protein FliE n=2 Tax=Methylobacterium tarhaniae TaxID=1187852 RepID=A0A0J6SI71_9HYPH|nr:flagellar hook-basal body complex protein FliE [Methylobacterium tarhaniae]KMO33364.1 flagellar hook-basal body protein FliE [Methylobacterium tarhaniae]